MAKRGRPRKEISKETFEKLCAIMCTEEEICGVFGITDKTLTRWCKETYDMNFSEAFKVYSADGRISLRRKQFKLADRSAAMAIFLGKQYLGQKDYPDDELSEAVEKLNETVSQLLGGVDSVIE